MRSRPGLLLVFTVALASAASAGSWAQEDAAVQDEDAAVVFASPLNGLAEAAVRAKLGDPALARTEGAGAFWTYRLRTCVLFVYFADAGQGLRVSGAAAGPRRHGDPTPDVASCIIEAGQPRSAAPSEAAPAQP